MTTKLLLRRLNRLRQADSSRPIVIDVSEGESLTQARKRAQAKHGDLDGRDLVFIMRTGATDDKK